MRTWGGGEEKRVLIGQGMNTLWRIETEQETKENQCNRSKQRRKPLFGNRRNKKESHSTKMESKFFCPLEISRIIKGNILMAHALMRISFCRHRCPLEQWSDLEMGGVAKQSRRQKILAPRCTKTKQMTRIRQWNKHMQANWGDLLNSIQDIPPRFASAPQLS